MILDLGCGGGWEAIQSKGEVVGVDISLTSLKNANKLYKKVVLSDLKNLPFKANVFDWVVTLDVLGHIPKEDKNRCFPK